MRFVFYLLSTWTITSAVLAITMRNLVHCAIALMAFFAGIAGVFFSLHADFLGAVQILIYVGAIAILILFAIMLTRNITGDEHVQIFSSGAMWGCIVSLLVLAIIIYVLQDLPVSEKPIFSPNLSVSELGEAFMVQYAIPFEVLSLLLTAVLVGAIVIALEETNQKTSLNSEKP